MFSIYWYCSHECHRGCGDILHIFGQFYSYYDLAPGLK